MYKKEGRESRPPKAHKRDYLRPESDLEYRRSYKGFWGVLSNVSGRCSSVTEFSLASFLPSRMKRMDGIFLRQIIDQPGHVAEAISSSKVRQKLYVERERNLFKSGPSSLAGQAQEGKKRAIGVVVVTLILLIH